MTRRSQKVSDESLPRELLELLLRSPGEIVEGGFVAELQKEINIKRRSPKGVGKKVAPQGLLDKKLSPTRYLDELKKHLSFACAGLPSRSSG